MSVLLRQTDGFEGLRAIQKINLPDDHASAKSHELKELLVDGDAASRSMPAHLGRDEHLVPQVEDFLGVEPDIVEGLEQLSPELMESVMAVVDGVCIGDTHVGVIFVAGVIASDGHVEVASIRRRVSLPYKADKHRAAQPRVARQPRPRGKQKGDKRGEARQDPIIQGPVLLRFGSERDSDTPHGLGLLLRHRPRSIPQAQESA